MGSVTFWIRKSKNDPASNNPPSTRPVVTASGLLGQIRDRYGLNGNAAGGGAGPHPTLASQGPPSPAGGRRGAATAINPLRIRAAVARSAPQTTRPAALRSRTRTATSSTGRTCAATCRSASACIAASAIGWRSCSCGFSGRRCSSGRCASRSSARRCAPTRTSCMGLNRCRCGSCSNTTSRHGHARRRHCEEARRADAAIHPRAMEGNRKQSCIVPESDGWIASSLRSSQ